jgi:hypothetical protein
MFFEMGDEGPEIRQRLARRPGAVAPLCRGSVGISTTDRWPALPPDVRVFVFAPGSWTRERYRYIRERLDG